MITPLWLPCAAWAQQAQPLDRVVAAVGNSAITQSDVIQEYRLEMFLDQGLIPGASPDPAAFDRARTRLVSQELLQQEIGAYPANSKTLRRSAEKQLAAVRKKFNSDSDFETALHTLGMSEDQLLKRLEDQQHVLAMIDERMRPSATVTSEDVQQYYHKTFLPKYQASHPGAAPPLDQVQDQIEQILVQKKINELLDEWLSQMKTEQHVRIIPEPKD